MQCSLDTQHRASSKRGLHDTQGMNPELEAHSRSYSTGILLDKSL